MSDTLEKQTKQFVDSLAAEGGEPIYKMSIPDARAVLEKLQSQVLNMPTAEVEQRNIRGGRLGEIPIRIVRPRDLSGKLPALMYFHGGGWILGSFQTHERLVRELANVAQSAVIFVEYASSPEAHYPKALEQAYTATKYIAEHGESFDLNVSRLSVAGDSAGGNMATAVTMLAKQRGGPNINLQLLFYPVTDASLDNGSYRQFAEGPWLTQAAMKWFWEAYAPDAATREKPTVSPLQASLKQLQGLPPALVITGENDVLRDEGEGYAHKLMQAGVQVNAVRYLGTIHDFMMLNALSNTPAARSATALAARVLREGMAVPQEQKQVSGGSL
jgi:acetyl esterase